MALLIVSLVVGVITAFIAANKGRNAVGWFLIGFFGGLIGLIIACVMSNLKEERARYDRASSERRRLREELKMERMRVRQFEAQANRRLDIHDRALGVETGKEAVPPALAARPVAGQVAGPPKAKADTWYYAPDGREAVGPLNFQDFAADYRVGRFAGRDLVWKSGWKEWRPLADVAGLEESLGAG